MTLTKTKSLNVARFVATCLCVVMIFALFAATASAQTPNQDEARAKRSKELEAKIAEVSKEFGSLRSKWKAASAQAKSNIEAELSVAKTELKKSYAQLQTAYEEDVNQLDDSLNEAWAEFESKGAQAREMATKEIDGIRARWNSAVNRRQRVYQERVQQLRSELADVESQIKSASDDASKEWDTKLTEIRKEYEAYAQQLRKSHQAYIASLNSEVQRIQKNATAASDDVKAEMMAKSDELNMKMNAGYDELHAGYKEMANKANSYVEQTYTRMRNASDDAKGKVQLELDEVSQNMTAMQAEMAASYEEYHASLEAQIASVKKRAATASAQGKDEMNELADQLEAKRQTAEQDMVKSYKSCAASIQKDIDRMNASVGQADAEMRAELVKAIERREAELEKIKEKLR